MKDPISNKIPNNKIDILLSHNAKIDKETNTSFWEQLFFGPHEVEGEKIPEEENEAIMQQLAWWSRME